LFTSCNIFRNSSDISVKRELFDVPISDLKLEKLPSVGGDSSIQEAIELMQKSKMGSLCLVKDNYAVGLISERDLVHKYDLEDPNWTQKLCKSVMTPGPFTIKEGNLVSDAIKMMAKRDFRNIPVVNDKDEFVTMLTIKDLLGFLVEFFPDRVANHGIVDKWTIQTVDDYSEGFTTASENLALVSGNIFMTHLKRVSHHRPLVLDHEASITEAIELMRERKRGAIIITRYETEIKGIVTERDLLFKVFGKSSIDGNLKVKDFMTPNPHTLLSKHYLAHAINNMFHFKYRSSLIVNEDRYPIAIVSLLDIFKYVAYAFYGDEISLLNS
jgi:CBS domain-containing protein